MVQIKVDGTKLVEILESKGLKCGEVSTALGFASSYVSNVKKRNKGAQPFFDGLESKYGISIADIRIEEKPEEKPFPAEDDPFCAVMKVELDYKAIEDAVYRGIRKYFDYVQTEEMN